MIGFSVPCFNTLAHTFPGESEPHLSEQNYFEDTQCNITSHQLTDAILS